MYRLCSHHSRERMYSRSIEGGICGVWLAAGGWSVQSYRLAACLNVLRRVYSSYQFPGKYLYFRAPMFSFPLLFSFPSLSFFVPLIPAYSSIAIAVLSKMQIELILINWHIKYSEWKKERTRLFVFVYLQIDFIDFIYNVRYYTK